MLKKIIFDIDDTLMEFPKDYYIYFNQLLKQYNINITARMLYEIIGKYETSGRYAFYDKRLLLDHINQELQLNLDKRFLDDFFNMYNSLISPISRETFDTLDYLHSKYELVTLSNWFTDSQESRLKCAGISNYFDKIYGTDLVPMKPNYDSYLSVMGDRKACECLMVGDNIEMDIKTPDIMGMKVYYLGRKKTSYPTIDALERLKEML